MKLPRLHHPVVEGLTVVAVSVLVIFGGSTAWASIGHNAPESAPKPALVSKPLAPGVTVKPGHPIHPVVTITPPRPTK